MQRLCGFESIAGSLPKVQVVHDRCVHPRGSLIPRDLAGVVESALR
jgi:hypothetical protein